MQLVEGDVGSVEGVELAGGITLDRHDGTGRRLHSDAIAGHLAVENVGEGDEGTMP